MGTLLAIMFVSVVIAIAVAGIFFVIGECIDNWIAKRATDEEK